MEVLYIVDLTVVFFTQSSWLRDALSEIDPSCHKLTFIANPKVCDPSPYRLAPKPLLRILAVGTFGSTEVSAFMIHSRRVRAESEAYNLVGLSE